MILNVQQVEDGTIIEGIRPFNLKAMLDCGQAFRWVNIGEGFYRGIVGNRVIKLKQVDVNKIFIKTSTNGEDITYWIDYFDLLRDYKTIEEQLKKEPVLNKVVEYSSGNRIMKQDPWETTISFIISANNNIPRIKKIIENLSTCFGEPIEFQGKVLNSFPGPRALASVSEDSIKKCGCGYRAEYIKKTADMVYEKQLDLEQVAKMSTVEARKELLRLPGVGPKVADCILLYSMRKFDVFPVDVWIKRTIEILYFQGEERPLNYIREFAQERFGHLAGFAQVYMFYYARENFLIRNNALYNLFCIK
ncbi:MAG: N-glycosylase/DNA lyase [Thermosediminibacterales bacterium]|nr:N-glycosylase/DNA lyase [Thermosediminibacterales bacterium]MDK2835345.1 N-glycosylase/DNA lyase [Thermosediminibacterales bacterium]